MRPSSSAFALVDEPAQQVAPSARPRSPTRTAGPNRKDSSRRAGRRQIRTPIKGLCQGCPAIEHPVWRSVHTELNRREAPRSIQCARGGRAGACLDPRRRMRAIESRTQNGDRARASSGAGRSAGRTRGSSRRGPATTDRGPPSRSTSVRVGLTRHPHPARRPAITRDTMAVSKPLNVRPTADFR